MSLILGKDVALQLYISGDYVTIGCAVSCSFEFSNEIILKTDANAGLFRKKRVRISDCRGSVQGVLRSESTPTVLSAWQFLEEGIRRSENDMRFLYTDVNGNDKVISGLWLVQTVSFVSDVSAFTDFDIQFEGTGDITITDIADPGEIVCDEWQWDTWEGVEAELAISGAGVEGRTFTGKEIIAVYREGIEYDPASGTPGNREYGYDNTEISFENAFNPAAPTPERVYVIWLEEGGS
jgi:hypothetical protein